MNILRHFHKRISFVKSGMALKQTVCEKPGHSQCFVCVSMKQSALLEIRQAPKRTPSRSKSLNTRMLIYCEVHGGPTERGLRIGKQLSAEIHAFYDHFLKETFQTERESELEERLLESAVLHSSLIRSFVSEAAQELDAISVSARCAFFICLFHFGRILLV